MSRLPNGVTAALFWRWPRFWRSATSSLLSTLPSAAWTPLIGERQHENKTINTDAVTKNGRLILIPLEVCLVAVPYFDPRMVNGRGMSKSQSTTNDWLQICRVSALKTQYPLTPYSTFSLISTINPEIHEKNYFQFCTIVYTGIQHHMKSDLKIRNYVIVLVTAHREVFPQNTISVNTLFNFFTNINNQSWNIWKNYFNSIL